MENKKGITKKLEIIIDDERFLFDNNSEVKVESNGYDLYITEPDFDKATENWTHGYTSKPIHLPREIEDIVNRNSTELPCSKIYEDSQKRKRLYTYFD